MRRIYTVSIDTDLEREIDDYQKNKGYETRSEGAIQLLKKGLKYDSEIDSLQKKIKEGKEIKVYKKTRVKICDFEKR